MARRTHQLVADLPMEDPSIQFCLAIMSLVMLTLTHSIGLVPTTSTTLVIDTYYGQVPMEVPVP